MPESSDWKTISAQKLTKPFPRPLSPYIGTILSEHEVRRMWIFYTLSRQLGTRSLRFSKRSGSGMLPEALKGNRQMPDKKKPVGNLFLKYLILFFIFPKPPAQAPKTVSGPVAGSGQKTYSVIPWFSSKEIMVKRRAYVG